MNTKLAIFAALSHEISSIKSEMNIDERLREQDITIFQGKYKDIPIILVQCGMGKEKIRRSIEIATNRYKFPFAINIGYCGGLSPELSAGDVIIANEVLDDEDQNPIRQDSNLIQRVKKTCEINKIKFRDGKIVTCGEAVFTPHEKAFVGTKYGAIAIDMESYAFLHKIKLHEIDALVVRVVLDAMDVELLEIGGVDEDGNLDALKLVGNIIKHPKLILKTPKFQFMAAEARNSLTNFISGWCKDA